MDYREAAAFLAAHDNYLILTHKRPDGDTIGCAAGLCRALRKLGKTAYVLPNEDATSLLAGYLDGLTAPDSIWGWPRNRAACSSSPASTRVRMWVEEMVTPSSSTLGITSQPIPSWTHLSANRRGLPSPL